MIPFPLPSEDGETEEKTLRGGALKRTPLLPNFGRKMTVIPEFHTLGHWVQFPILLPAYV